MEGYLTVKIEPDKEGDGNTANIRVDCHLSENSKVLRFSLLAGFLEAMQMRENELRFFVEKLFAPGAQDEIARLFSSLPDIYEGE